MNLFTILNANNYFTVNREIAKKIGLNAAIMLSEIVDKYCFFESKNLLNDGWFYLTVESVEERSCLGKDAQMGAINKLVSLGFIETKRIGVSSRRHFKVFRVVIEKWMTSYNKFEETRQPNGGTQTSEWREPANRMAGTRQVNGGNPPSEPGTAHIVYKSLREEPEEEKEIHKEKSPQAGPRASPQSVSFGKFVHLTKEEYEALCKQHSVPLITEMIDLINDYLSSTGKKPYKDYAATIRNWIRRQKKSPHQTGQNDRWPKDKDGNRIDIREMLGDREVPF